MSSYAETARHRKRARALYLELRALGLEVRAEDDTSDLANYRIVVRGLRSLSPVHADRLMRQVEANHLGLANVLLERWNPDLHAVRTEGRLA